MLRNVALAVGLLLVAVLALPIPALSHGTSDPGPHGGEIRMPGAFHVEAIAGDDALRIYVLDMQFDNPIVDHASLEARIVQGGSTTRLECQPGDQVKAFICQVPDNINLDEGKLIVDATRKGKPSQPAKYDLPLKWSGD